jgi:hypothetical protein
MPTPQQIEANRQNSQSSTGPKTEAGKERSSRNATRHGLTGQNLVLSPEEKEPYETHCISYLEKFAPANQEETILVQQTADFDWSLQQIAIQQLNLMALINAITTKLMAAGEFEAVAEANAPHIKALNTLSLYEQRRRRAADAVLQRLTALIEARKAALKEAAAQCKAHKAQGKPWTLAEFGFVCSQAEIDTYLRRENAAAEVKKLLAATKS